MKKATAATVAQSIKSTKQLSQLQGLAPAKSCKPPLKSSCSALQIDADQANLHLDLLGLDETCTNIRLIPHKGRRGGAINGIFAKDLDRAQDLNRQGYGVYVQVNIASGTKSDDVTACTALFCEWDDRPVDDQLVLWQSLGLPEPTFMVMTGGKSVHLYWVLTVPIEPERWVPLIDRLVAYADSDRSCKGLNRMMRLAGGYYIDRDGEAKSITQIVNVTGYCYEAAQFEELLPLLPSGMTCRRAPRKFSSTPASLRQITEALDCIPRRLEGAGTYAVYRNILWGLVDACAEAGYGKDFAAKSSCIHLNTGSLNFVDAPKNSPILEKNMNKVIIKLLPLLLLLAGESSAQTVIYDVSFGGVLFIPLEEEICETILYRN